MGVKGREMDEMILDGWMDGQKGYHLYEKEKKKHLR